MSSKQRLLELHHRIQLALDAQSKLNAKIALIEVEFARHSTPVGSESQKPVGKQTATARAAKLAYSVYRKVPLGPYIRSGLRGGLAALAPVPYAKAVSLINYGRAEAQAAADCGPSWLFDIVDRTEFRQGFWRLTHDLADHVAKHGKFTHMLVLPFFARGGSEATALNFCRVVLEVGPGCAMLVAADRQLNGADRFATPTGVFELDLADYFPDADLDARQALLLGVLRIASPTVFHIINSEVGWHLLLKAPERVKAVSRVFASIFAFQFDPITREKVGYAASFLVPGLRHLEGLLSDNQRFVDDARREYGLGAEGQRLAGIYNPCALLEGEQTAPEQRISQIASSISSSSRLQVLWAGRLDAEKRIDLIPKIARLCPDMDFHVHGTQVVDLDGSVRGLDLPNVTLHGSFGTPIDVVSRSPGHVLMFTSRWEGLPNVLLEFGSLGVPIVAATVGGVGELIDEVTGYPLSENASAEDYAESLRSIASNPAEAALRAVQLLSRLRARHSFEAFSNTVKTIPSYLSDL